MIDKLKIFIFSSCIFCSFELFSNQIKNFSVLEYGTSFFSKELVNTLENSNIVKFAWLFYYIEDTQGHKILIDTGFENESFAKNFGIKDYKKPSILLQENGIHPDLITDIILTHSHFDHIGGIGKYLSANLYINKKEFISFKNRKEEYQLHKKNIERLIRKNKLFLIEDKFILYNLFTIEWTGGHTTGSQVVKFQIDSQEYIITGDECYFIDACYEKVTLPKQARYSYEKNSSFLSKILPHQKLFTLHDPALSKNHIKGRKEIYVLP